MKCQNHIKRVFVSHAKNNLFYVKIIYCKQNMIIVIIISYPIIYCKQNMIKVIIPVLDLEYDYSYHTSTRFRI